MTTLETNHGKDLSRTAAIIVFAVIIAGQAALTLTSFKSKDDLLNDQPIVNVDFCSQYYWAHAAREFADRDERMWGYDPYFMAGYPLSFVFNSSLPVQLIAVAFDEANLARLVKACFVISFMLVPVCLYFAMRQFGLKQRPALAACLLGTTYFWVGENALYGNMGMISGAFILSFFMVPLGLLFRYLRYQENRAFSMLLFPLAAAFTIHKTGFVLITPVALVWIALFAPRLERRDWGTLGGIAIFVAICNLHWLYPFFKFLPLKIEDPTTTFFQNTDALRLLKDLWPLPPHPHYAISQIRLLIIGAGVIGMLKARRDDQPLFVSFVPVIALFGIFVYFGSFIEAARHLQPYRYVTAFFYLWLPAAGIGLVDLHERVANSKRAKIAAPASVAAFVVLLLLALLVMPSFRAFTKLAPLSTQLDPPTLALKDWIEKNTDQNARVLIEDVNAWDGDGPALYGGARFVQLLPLLVPRELVGGPLPNAFIKHHHAGFHDGRLLDRPVEKFTDRELQDALKLYNVGWVACWKIESRLRFTGYPHATSMGEFGPVEVFTLGRDHNFFLEGAGKVETDFNRIKLSGLTTDSGRVVISYHWAPGLRSVPEAELTPVMIGDDPVGFIGVVDPPKELELSLGVVR